MFRLYTRKQFLALWSAAACCRFTPSELSRGGFDCAHDSPPASWLVGKRQQAAALQSFALPNLRDLGRGSGGGQDLLEDYFHFGRFESKRSGLALVGDAAIAVDHVEAVRPRGVGLFRGVLEIVDDGGNPQRQLGGANSFHLAAFGKGLGTCHRNLIFLVGFSFPGVNGVGFQNIDHIECRAVFVFIVELVERGNLPAERRSGVTPENQHHRPLPAEGSKRN